MGRSIRFHAITLNPTWLIVGLIAVVTGVAIWLLSGGGALPTTGDITFTAPQVGQPAPALSLPNLNGQIISLSHYRGQPVIVYFWASWCPFCAVQTPRLNEVAKQYANEDLVVLAVNIMESQQAVQQYVAQQNISFPVLRDENGQVATTWLVRLTPTYYFVDRAGIVRAEHIGELDEGTMTAAILAIIPSIDSTNR